MSADLITVLVGLSGFLLLFAAYAVRSAIKGRARNERVERDGSVLVSKWVIEAVYWALGAAARAAIAVGMSANAVTWMSLALGVCAGTALALGHFGLGGLLGAASALSDSLDGIVARETGTGSDAGEALDASVDRYTEFFFIGGLCVLYRESAPLLLLSLSALLASFMVSYSTAKAEALQVTPPRGLMRRGERAAYLLTAASLTPIAQALPTAQLAPRAGEALMLLALALVGVIGNVSAVRRLGAIMRELSATRPARRGGAGSTSEPERPMVLDQPAPPAAQLGGQ